MASQGWSNSSAQANESWPANLSFDGPAQSAVVYLLVRSSDGAVQNIVVWDGKTPFVPPSATRRLVISRPQVYVPGSPWGGTAPLADADINTLKAAIPARRAEVAQAMATNPFPAPTGSPTTNSTTVWGALAQAFALLERNASGDATAANSLLATVLPAIPTISGFQALADPVSQTPGGPATLVSDYFHVQVGTILYCILQRHGASGTTRLSSGNRSAAVSVFWEYAHDLPYAYLAKTPGKSSGVFWGSENRGVMTELCCYAAAHLAASDGTLSGQAYGDGSTPAQQYAAWRTRVVSRLKWMGRYGTLCEMGSPTYTQYSLSALYAFALHAPDSDVRAAGKALIDLWWCVWAQEQVGGWHGGPRNRNYPSVLVTGEPIGAMSWLYFGFGTVAPADANSHEYGPLGFNDYTPPDVAFDLAVDVSGRGRYVVQTRQPSANALWNGSTETTDADGYINVDTTLSAAPSLRYSYVTPEFTMGSIRAFHADKRAYLSVASQNRWNCVVFDGGRQRIVVASVPPANDDADAGTLAVQSNATMIVAYQPAPYSNNASGNAVRFGDMLDIVEQDAAGGTGWVFAAGATGYAAVKVAGGTYTWGPGSFVPPAVDPPNSVTLLPSATNLPIVVQAAGNSDFDGLDAFQAAVLAGITVANAGGVVTVTGGFFGAGTLVFNTSTWATPTVGGVAAAADSAFAFQSPFVNGTWGGSMVAVAKGARSLSLSFRDGPPLVPLTMGGDAVKMGGDPVLT